MMLVCPTVGGDRLISTLKAIISTKEFYGRLKDSAESPFFFPRATSRSVPLVSS